MRLKVIALFLALQLLSFGIWKTMSSPQTVMADPVPVAVTAPVTVTHAAAGKAAAPKIDFAVRNLESSQATLIDSAKSRILEAMAKLPAGHTASVGNIILDYDKNAYRGLGGNKLIILRAVNMGDTEFVGVLIHEIGHNVDFAFLKPADKRKKSAFMDMGNPVYSSDNSVRFYGISWMDEKTMKNAANNMDFVSGYAMSDPFEDFAETYAYYVLHGNDFRALTATSEALYAKYNFMKNVVFNGIEFDTDDGKVEANNRPWDVTLISYNLDNFLAL